MVQEVHRLHSSAVVFTLGNMLFSECQICIAIVVSAVHVDFSSNAESLYQKSLACRLVHRQPFCMLRSDGRPDPVAEIWY